MKTYYIRGVQVYVQIDSDTKKIVNVINIPMQKGISVLDNIDYYNMIMTQIEAWTITDENTFRAKYDEVLNYISNI